MSTVTIIILLSTLLCLLDDHVVIGGQAEKKLLAKLFDNYNIYERPVKNYKDPLTVQMGLYLTSIMEVKAKEEVIKTNMWMNLAWNDSNLTWNIGDYNNISSISVDSAKVWKPDLLLYNSAADGFDTVYATSLIVYSNGYITWLPPALLTSTCKFDIKWFPFDEQNCSLKFSSWTYDKSQIDLHIKEDEQTDPTDLSEYQRNGEWNLLSFDVVRIVDEFEDNQYVSLKFTIGIRRRPLYYMFNLIYPCVIISAMALLTFTLPADSGEKIGLGMNILLCLMMFSLLVAEMIPASETVSLLGLYFACIMFMCGFCVVITVLILNYHHRNNETHEMPNWVRVVICRWLAWILRMKRPGEDLSRDKFMSNVKINKYLENVVMTGKHPYYSSKDPSQCGPDGDRHSVLAKSEVSSSHGDPQAIFQRVPDLYSIYNELKFMTERQKEEDKADDINQLWIFASMVLDRLCLIVFLLYTIITTCAILLAAPQAFGDDTSLSA